jgi:tryptophan synthase alpha chain
LKEAGAKALVGFASAGDPDLPTSLEILAAMCEAGLDVLELGIPFSDPTADGPVIQRASARALKGGASLVKALDITARLRKLTDIPLILFSYYNPVFVYGAEPFYRDALAAGADGVLIVDLPHEESRELTDCWNDADAFALIRLVAPTTPKDRMKKIAGHASGFLYLVSKTGVTGSAGLDTASVRSHVADLRAVTDLPLCVGFGINDPDQARMLAPYVDGVVVGSAFERTIEENLTSPDLAQRLAQQVRHYKAALAASAGKG